LINELALFAGAGGGILGGALCGWRTVCAVEIDPYCRSVLLARQRDGFLAPFPIWDDVGTFDGRPWRGTVDVVSGGFPCQPFSTAARGRNNAVDRWPDMLRIVGEVAPRYVLAENVQRDPIARAADDLAGLGYGVTIVQAPAAAVGAPHDRPRWWAVAYSDSEGESRRAEHAKMARVPGVPRLAWAEDLAGALGVAHGLADRVDRLRAIGNGQCPAVVRLVWETVIGPT